MIAHKQKKAKKKRVWASGQPSAAITTSEMGLKSVSSSSSFDPEYIKELVNDVRKFSHMLLYLKEAILSDCFKEVIHIRLDELLRVLKSILSKHQNLSSVDLQSAAEVLTAKVKAVNFTEVNEENKNDIFREVFSSIETLAFTFGNILTNFLMGDVGSDSILRLPTSRESKSFENISVDSVDLPHEKGNFSPIELDNLLLKNTDSIELALSYAKTWSKYTKNIVSWVEKKLNLELESTRNIVKLAEATRSSIGIQEFMPLQSLFTNALLSDIHSSHLLQQTIAALQANKFVQPLLGRKNEMEKQRKEIKDLWKQQQNKLLETETALKKAKLLCMQRQDEYEKAKSSMFRAEEEQLSSSVGLAKNLNKQLEKRRRLEEEALLASSPTERSSRDVGNVDSDKFGKNPAFEGLHRKDNSNTTRSKVNGFDQQNVRKSWDTQYVRNNFTAKTTMIVPSAYPEKGLTVNTGNNRDHPGSKAHAEPARAAGDVSERRSSDSCPATAVRAPRTLQPQHWTTFYKPPNPTFSVRGTEEKTALPSIAVPPVLVHAPQIHVTKSDPDSEATLACPVQTSGQPKESSEEPALPEGTPTCQRPRLKRMQQFEDLEDEIPQFV
nr:Arhgap29 protein [Mus musculus]